MSTYSQERWQRRMQEREEEDGLHERICFLQRIEEQLKAFAQRAGGFEEAHRLAEEVRSAGRPLFEKWLRLRERGANRDAGHE